MFGSVFMCVHVYISGVGKKMRNAL